MRDLIIHPAQFGLVVSYTFAGATRQATSAGDDRFGRKPAFLSLLVGFLIGALLCGLALTYAALDDMSRGGGEFRM
jgi:MFS family permease